MRRTCFSTALAALVHEELVHERRIDDEAAARDPLECIGDVVGLQDASLRPTGQ
jgi:hypothetical protein